MPPGKRRAAKGARNKSGAEFDIVKETNWCLRENVERLKINNKHMSGAKFDTEKEETN